MPGAKCPSQAEPASPWGGRSRPEELKAGGGESYRVRWKRGNRDLWGLDLVWSDEADIESRENPRDAIVMERREWGDFYGYFRSLEVDGETVQRVRLDTAAHLEVAGRLGACRIEIDHGRARIAAAPCRQQVCVRRGWLDAAGAVSVCVPNGLVLRLEGNRGRPLYGGPQECR